MMKQNKTLISRLILIAVVVSVIILLIILFRGCGEKNVHVDNKSEKDSTDFVVQLRNKKDSITISEFKIANDTLKNIAIRQKQVISFLEVQLKSTGKRANQISNSITKAKVERDTSAYIKNCDSLTGAVAELTGLIDVYQAKQRELVNGLEFQLAYKDSIISIQTAGRAELFNSYKQVSSKYDLLYRDYSKAIKKGKRERTLTRILAGALLLAGGKILLSN